MPGAVPAFLPNCPAYLSSSAVSSRSSRDAKKRLLEEKQVAAAIESSQKEHEHMLKKNACDSLEVLKNKIAPPTPWHTVSENGSLIIFSFEDNPENQTPTFDTVVVVNENLLLNIHVKSVKLPKIGDYSLPATINSVQTVYHLLDEVQSLRATGNALNAKVETKNAFSVVLLLILSLLEPYKDQVENYGYAIWLICEQLSLIINKKLPILLNLLFLHHYFAMCHHMHIDFCETVAIVYCQVIQLFEELHYPAH